MRINPSSQFGNLAGRVFLACGAIFCVLSVPVSAQQYAGQYQFAPRDGVPDQSWQDPLPQYGTEGTTAPHVSPGGRTYRFRDDPKTRATPDQPRFRPDSKFGQMPKNWGSSREWAEDPVLRQGMVFRPLDEKRDDSNAQDSGAPPAPPSYGYPPTGLGYPGTYPPPVPWGM